MKLPSIVCVIPARYASSRFPGKILASLGGKPMVQRTWQAARACSQFSRVLIAVDAPQTAEVVASFGGQWVMTPSTCLSGTDRIAYLAQHGHLTEEVVVNWQCDEPFINAQMIDDLLQDLSDQSVAMWTLKKRITNTDEIVARNVAKVVSDAYGNALYFSRSPIPLVRDVTPEKPYGDVTYYKHIGLYAYTVSVLTKIVTLAPCDTEMAEQLEQLRLLHYGLRIRLHETQCSPVAIDTPADLVRAEEHWRTLAA